MLRHTVPKYFIALHHSDFLGSYSCNCPLRCKRYRPQLSPQYLHSRILRPAGLTNLSYPKLPNEKDDVTGSWLVAVVLPKSAISEPFDTPNTACKFWDNVCFDISALISAPRNEAGTPFYTRVKAVPLSARGMRRQPFRFCREHKCSCPCRWFRRLSRERGFPSRTYGFSRRNEHTENL